MQAPELELSTHEAPTSAAPADRRLMARDGRSPTVVARRHGRRDFLLRRLLAVSDLCAISLALALVVAIYFSGSAAAGRLLWGLATLPVWIVVFKAYGLYDRDIKRISQRTVDDIPWLLHALLVGCVVLWAFLSALPGQKLVFHQVLVFGLVALVLILLLRTIARAATISLLGAERVLLVGQGEMLETLVHKMRMHREYGLEPVGLATDSQPAELGSLHLLGGLNDVGGLIARHRVDRVVVSPGETDEATLLRIMRRCKELSVKVSVLPNMTDALGPSVEVDDLEGVTVLGVNPPVLSRSSRSLKRSMDLIGAALLLVLALPWIALIAAAIKLDSRGPVFFKQRRVGKRGRRFELVKFRTMVRDAEQMTAQLAAQSQDPDWLKLEHDPRITRVGRLLRLTSLDELPGLCNVLKGEMSLVGPRPLIESEDRLIEGWARGRLDLTPGVTGYWQVLGRTNIPFAEMVKLDYLYVTNWSLWTDVRLILRTLPAVVTRRGAN